MSITTEQAAAWFADRAKNTPMPGARAMFEIAAAALQEKAEREDPQPLTLEELRKMDGEPVWVKPKNADGGEGEWCVVHILSDKQHFDVLIPGIECMWYESSTYIKEWTAYRHKPKEVDGRCSK